MLPTQPLTEPLAGMRHHLLQGRRRVPQTEVVRPTYQLAVETIHHHFRGQPQPLPARLLADFLADPVDFFPEGRGPR